MTHICHPRVRKVTHPGIEVPGQQVLCSASVNKLLKHIINP